jgi:hypothetical protein
MKYLRGKNKSPCMETFKFHIHRTLFHVQTFFTKYNDFFFAASSVCQSPVISSSIKLSKALPFYAVGSEINYQCSKPGYEISGIFNLWKYLYTLFWLFGLLKNHEENCLRILRRSELSVALIVCPTLSGIYIGCNNIPVIRMAFLNPIQINSMEEYTFRALLS